MKKLLLRILTIIMALSFSLFFIACNGDDTGNEPPAPTLSLNAESVRLVLGDEYGLSATYSEESWVDFEWASSNDAVVTVDANGTVRSVGLGSATVTATYDELTATCLVNVVTGDNVPSIEAVHSYGNKINAIVNAIYTLDYTVAFRGKTYDNATFTYESSNPEVGTVNAAGEFKALSKGTTDLIVEGTWCGQSPASLKTVVTVNVVDDVQILVNGGATSKVRVWAVTQHNGMPYDATADVKVGIKYNGQDVDADEIKMLGSSVATYSDGVVTGFAYGTDTLRISYGEYHLDLPVEVARPITDYKYGTLDFSTYQGTLDYDDIFNKTDVQIIEAYQDGKPLTVVDNVISGLSVSRSSLTNTTLTIVDASEGYNINVNAAYAIIDEASDMEVFDVTAEKLAALERPSGYVYLKNDIVMETALAHTGVATNGSSTSIDVGFAGIFEGNGHKITAPVSKAGLFGAVYGYATGVPTEIKNLNLDLTVTANGSVALNYLKGNMAAAKRVEYKNIQVKVSGTVDSFSGISGYDNYPIDYKNVIVDLSDLNTSKGTSFVMRLDNYLYTGSISNRNVYIISDLPLANVVQRSVKDANGNVMYYSVPNGVPYGENEYDSAPGKAFVSEEQYEKDTTGYKFKAKGCYRYETPVALAEDSARYSFEGFDSILWDYHAGYPTMKSDDTKLQVGGKDKGLFTAEKGDTLKVTLKNEGNPLAFTLTSSNTDVATISGDTIVAEANGVSEITVSYELDGVQKTKVVYVKVGEVVEVEGTFDLSAMDGDLDLQGIFGTTEVEIFKIVHGTKQLTVKDNKIVGLEVSDVDFTYLTVDIYADIGTYKVNLRACTKIIYSAADLALFNVTDETITYGYYMLGNDINLDEDIDLTTDGVQKVDLSHSALRDHQATSNAGYGFAGVFDGQGYTISGTAVKRGIFGSFYAPGIIKNLAMNVTLSDSGATAILALNTYAPNSSNRLTLENVYVKVSGNVTMFNGLFGRTSCYTDATSLLIDITGVTASDYAYAFSHYMGNYDDGSLYKANYGYAVGNYYYAGKNANKLLAANEEITDSTTQKKLGTIYRYTTLAALAAARTTATSYGTQFTSDYWSIQELKNGETVVGYIPVWVGNTASAE